MPERRNLQATVVAVSAAIATVALAGIFVLYLIDTIGGDDSSKRSPGGTSGPTSVTPQTPPPAGTTGGATGVPTPPAGSSGGTSGGSAVGPGARPGSSLPGAP